MTVDQRIEALTGNCQSLYSSVAELRAVAESHKVHFESLRASASELHAASQRHDASIEALIKESWQNGEHIRALVRLAEIC